MPTYIVETDAAGVPLDPVVGWHGPIAETVTVDWIAREENEEDEEVTVPEIEWPSCRHHRRPDWCHTGVRPPRPMPRGLRITIASAPGASGTEPVGIMDADFECWDDDPVSADRNVCSYLVNDGLLPRTTWDISTSVASHSTTSDPTDYHHEDFILRADARYRASDGSHWRLFIGPVDYAGAEPLPEALVPTLAIARQNLGTPANKVRTLIIEDPFGESCFIGRPWTPAFLPVDENGVGPVQTPEFGITFFEWTWEQVSLADTAGLWVLGLRTGGFQPIVYAQHQFRADPAERFVYSFQYSGFLHVSDLQPIAGDVVRVEINHEEHFSTALKAFVNDIEDWSVVDPSGWSYCFNDLHLTDLMGPGWVRSPIRLDWKPA